MGNQTDSINSKPFRGAWLAFAGILAINSFELVLILVNPNLPFSPGFSFRGFIIVYSLSLSFLGALIVYRYPHHRIGWLFNALGLHAAIQGLIQEFGYYGVFGQPSIAPGGILAAWVGNWIWVPGNGIMFLILMLFPDGKLPSARWRGAIWLAAANMIALMLAIAFSPGPLESTITSMDNPFSIENAETFFDMVYIISSTGYAAMFLAAAAGLIQRYQHAHGVERQQIKWVMYAVIPLAVILPTSLFVGVGSSWGLVVLLAFTFLVVAISISIFRYRLYDIDIIINRTLVYGALTGLLGAIYFVSAISMQQVFRALTGQDSSLSIVVSTLVIAALFTPLRRRIQNVIDRRFYRRKYDAEKTLAAFGATVRDEVELEQLSDSLLAVVEETMQPAHLSLWLKKTADTSASLTPYPRSGGAQGGTGGRPPTAQGR